MTVHQCYWTVNRRKCTTCHQQCSACGQCKCQDDRRIGEAVRANHAAARRTLRGRAAGGPRDRVMLEAPARWDGVVGDHEGRYTWNEADEAWQWVHIPRQRRDSQVRKARRK